MLISESQLRRVVRASIVNNLIMRDSADVLLHEKVTIIGRSIENNFDGERGCWQVYKVRSSNGTIEKYGKQILKKVCKNRSKKTKIPKKLSSKIFKSFDDAKKWIETGPTAAQILTGKIVQSAKLEFQEGWKDVKTKYNKLYRELNVDKKLDWLFKQIKDHFQWETLITAVRTSAWGKVVAIVASNFIQNIPAVRAVMTAKKTLRAFKMFSGPMKKALASLGLPRKITGELIAKVAATKLIAAKIDKFVIGANGAVWKKIWKNIKYNSSDTQLDYRQPGKKIAGDDCIGTDNKGKCITQKMWDEDPDNPKNQ